MRSPPKQGFSYSLRSRLSNRKPKVGRLILCLLILSVIIYIGLRSYISGSGRVLLVERVTVLGNRYLPAEEIALASGVRPGFEMKRVKPDRIASALLSRFSFLRSVEVDKSVSGEVVIRVQERKPVALLSSRGRYHLIDGEGVVLEEDVSPSRFEGLKVIDVGEGGEELVRASLSALRFIRLIYPAMFDRVVSIGADSPVKLRVLMEDGTELILSVTNLEKGLENGFLVYSIRKNAGLEGGYIDARDEKLVYCGGI